MPFTKSIATKPTVSLLVPARNEADNVLNLLHSIEKMSFPKAELEVLIGDDDSTDSTAELVANFIKNKPYFKLISIMESTTMYKGKTNALIQLIENAAGDFYFFTDADITLPSGWIEAMLSGFSGNVGVVVGATTTKPLSLFARMQGIEWLTVLKFMEILSRFKIKSTGMGNNMAVSAEAYRATGGYGHFPFSIVEDYALYDAIIKKGFAFKHIYSEKVLAFTQPPMSYLQQRKRWASGALKSQTPLLIFVLIQALLFPFFVIQFIIIKEVILYWVIIYVIILILISWVSLLKMNLNSWIFFLPIFPFYLLFSSFFQFVNYILPSQIIWKGRRY